MDVQKRHILRIVILLLGMLLALLPATTALTQGGDWEELFPDPAPAPRYGHTMVAMGSNIFLFGGMVQTGSSPSAAPLSQVPQNDLWAFNSRELSWIELASTNTPSARFSHTANAWGGRMYMFGGVDSSNNALGDLWTYEHVASDWQQLAVGKPGPPARKLHSSAMIEADGKFVLIGGKDQNDNPLSDVWVYDPFTDAWQQKTSYPGGGLYDFATSVYGNKVYIMGKDNNQMGVYDVGADTWSNITVTPAPPARRGAGYTYFANKAWILGGQDVETGHALNDTWEYDFETGSWVQVADMPMPLIQLVATYLYIQPTRAHTLAADQSFLLVFGGKDQSGQPQGRTFRYTPPSDYRIYLPLIMRQ